MMTEQRILSTLIAHGLNLSVEAVGNTLALLDEGCTIPFISRYRKERTGALDEVQIAAISDEYERLKDISRRKETIVKTITAQDKMTPQLQQRIDDCWDATVLEDIYLPFKPRRRTRAQIAREQGLEPLARLILLQREPDVERAAHAYFKGDVTDVVSALQGASDIIAETISEDERSRQQLRGAYRRTAVITSKVVKAKADTDEASKFSDYFDWHEPLRRCSSHRLLAMRRGEEAGILRLSIDPADDAECIGRLQRQWVVSRGTSSQASRLVAQAVEDSYKRLLKPSIETEFASLSKQQADDEAIRVFADNLRQLLLGAPLGQKRVMAVDPGFRTGCKVVCLDAQGNLLHHEAIFPHPPVNRRMQATVHVQQMLSDYHIEAIAIGNGTASRETRAFIDDVVTPGTVPVYVVSEDGASVYSASQTARDEFPDEDVTVRGAVSIGRRLIDPLAELVKIDPKSIGVGQYQHDVDQTKLKRQLDQTVESCVNMVGVNLNTASSHLLQYVSGLGPVLARNIVDYRRQHGAFTSRAQLLKVPRLGPSAYQQCAGFLRIPGASNPLDNTAVHPESYSIVQHMAADHHCTVADLIADKSLRQQIDPRHYVTDEVGIPTLTDIMSELDKPGRDPRQQLEAFQFDSRVQTVDDLEEGMVLPGIVTNITNFGAFVDIGVHQDGLVHISQMADRRIAHPSDVVSLHQHVQVKVTEVDRRRQRISLSMRGLLGLLLALLLTTGAQAQKVSPKAYYTDDNGIEQVTTSVDNGQAPLDVVFRANPENMEGFSPSYEWHFRKQNDEMGYDELFVRYEEDTQYTFTDSGVFSVVLRAQLQPDGTVLDADSITVSIPESRLEFPNAFSPNGDGLNDTYKAKKDYRSIVSFHATIINRWGQKLYEWHDPAGEWDGKFKGHDVPDGVYFVVVKAKGADGRVYNIRKDVNLLRGFYQGGTNSGGSTTTEQ